jgi:hypothetical protein
MDGSNTAPVWANRAVLWTGRTSRASRQTLSANPSCLIATYDGSNLTKGQPYILRDHGVQTRYCNILSQRWRLAPKSEPAASPNRMRGHNGPVDFTIPEGHGTVVQKMVMRPVSLWG